MKAYLDLIHVSDLYQLQNWARLDSTGHPVEYLNGSHLYANTAVQYERPARSNRNVPSAVTVVCANCHTPAKEPAQNESRALRRAPKRVIDAIIFFFPEKEGKRAVW